MSRKMDSTLPFVSAMLCETIYRFGMLEGNRMFTAREAVFGAALAGTAAAVLLFVLCLCRDGLCVRGIRGCYLAAAFLLCGTVMLETLLRIISVCRTEFGGALWAMLFALLVLGLLPAFSALQRMAYPVAGLAALGGILALIGIARQLRWQNLSFAPLTSGGVASAFSAAFVFIPEYLLLPLCTSCDTRKWLRLPALSGIVFLLLILCAEMLFGYDAANGCLSVREGIRAWGLGCFSRFDPLWTGLWLLLAYYRLLLLGSLMQKVWNSFRKGGECKI